MPMPSRRFPSMMQLTTMPPPAGHPGGALGGDVEPGLVVADHRAAGHNQPVGAPVGDAETVVLDVAGGDPDAPRGWPHLLLQFDEDAVGAIAPGRARGDGQPLGGPHPPMPMPIPAPPGCS